MAPPHFLIPSLLCLVACTEVQLDDSAELAATTRPDRCLTPGPTDHTVKLNHLRFKGTHNSYHQAPDIDLRAYIGKLKAHFYTHDTLDVQLEKQNVRMFELDVHLHDGRFLVYHLGEGLSDVMAIDAETTCETLVDCLQTIKTWSDANSCHVPIAVAVQIKDGHGGERTNNPGLVDREIRQVFPPDRLITPDLVRGEHETLQQALADSGWPTLAQARGRLMFMLFDRDKHQREYLGKSRDLRNQIMFAQANPDQFDQPWAAVSQIDDARAPEILSAHPRGILVSSFSCMASYPEAECRERLARGLEYGVHFLQDDFPKPVPERSFWLDLPRVDCNQVTSGDKTGVPCQNDLLVQPERGNR